MIRVASNVADDIVRRANELDATPMIRAAKTLPGYGTHERAIRSQFAPPETNPADDLRRDTVPAGADAERRR